MRSQRVLGKREILIPSVSCLRGTHETAPLGQQGEPLRFAISSRKNRGIVTKRTFSTSKMPSPAQNPAQRLQELVHFDGLGQVAVHPRLQGLFHVLGKGVGGHGQNG